LTVALSRARLGLYILGRRSLFESCFELRPAFEKLSARSDKLQLVTGETFPTKRGVDDDVEGVAEMEGVEHLGQYVYEMTNAKVADLKAGQGVLPPIAEDREEGDDDEDAEQEDEDEDVPEPEPAAKKRRGGD